MSPDDCDTVGSVMGESGTTGVSRLLGVELGFQPLLFKGDRHAVGTAMIGWGDSGLSARTLRWRKMRSRSGLFDEFAAALQFPLYFGENMNAFNECIADLETLPAGEGYVLTIVKPDQLLADEDAGALEWLVRSLQSAAETWSHPIDLCEWWDRPAVPLHVVLAGETETIELAAGRWSRAGLTPISWVNESERPSE